MRTRSGTIYRIQEVGRTGYGPSDSIRWKIIAQKELTNDEIFDIIESRYPSNAYGMSKFSRVADDNVEVTSNASCD